jgi:hypothetical protein
VAVKLLQRGQHIDVAIEQADVLEDGESAISLRVIGLRVKTWNSSAAL